MTDETQLKIFGLIDVARDQQADLSAAIEALKAEREALRADLAATVRQTLGQSSATALETATAPILDRLASVATATAQADDKLCGAVAWFSWRWAAIAGASAGGLLLATWLAIAAIAAIVGFYRGQLEDLRAEVAEQEATLKALSKAGGKARLSTCAQSGKVGRLCIQIDKTAGEFSNNFFVIRGY